MRFCIAGRALRLSCHSLAKHLPIGFYGSEDYLRKAFSRIRISYCMLCLSTSPLEQFQVHGSGGLGGLFTIYGSNLVVAGASLAIIASWGITANLQASGLRTDALRVWVGITYALYSGTVALALKATIMPLLALGLSIIAANLAGLIPCVITMTSHVLVTLMLSASAKAFVVVRTILLQRARSLRTFIPMDVPMALVPLLISLETVSYFVRAITLAVRLFANMTSGHILLAIVANATAFVCWAGSATSALCCLPIGIMALLLFMESAVAALQAVVFTLLLSQYVWETEHLH